ncbi:MAG: hypothetical protein LBT47_05255 [Deltaproteobacteria bacterium]|jgi:hypothetical protein|nr:hypothetical protein [Deltaproteobacteria bacterium]
MTPKTKIPTKPADLFKTIPVDVGHSLDLSPSPRWSLESDTPESVIVAIEPKALSPRVLSDLFSKSLLALVFIFMAAALPAQAQAPLDLAELGRRGLSEASRDIIVTQALTRRARPPLEIGFILDVAQYGGDDLVRTYLEMDATSSQSAKSPLAPEAMRNLMASGLAPAEIKSLIETMPVNEGPPPSWSAAAPLVSAPAVMVNMVNGGAFTEQDISQRPTVAPVAPVVQAPKPAQIASVGLVEASWSASQAGSTPPTKVELRRIPQTLAPGQSADPSRPLPEAPGPYWTRTRPAPDGFFMGVTTEVKDDGHRYEVHTNSRGRVMGQEVLSRSSGQKVVRHYNGRTESSPMTVDAPVSPVTPVVYYNNGESVKN